MFYFNKRCILVQYTLVRNISKFVCIYPSLPSLESPWISIVGCDIDFNSKINWMARKRWSVKCLLDRSGRQNEKMEIASPLMMFDDKQTFEIHKQWSGLDKFNHEELLEIEILRMTFYKNKNHNQPRSKIEEKWKKTFGGTPLRSEI